MNDPLSNIVPKPILLAVLKMLDRISKFMTHRKIYITVIAIIFKILLYSVRGFTSDALVTIQRSGASLLSKIQLSS